MRTTLSPVLCLLQRTRGTRSQCELLPGVCGIAERGNVISQWRGEPANYSQLGTEKQDQTHWKRMRLQTPQRRLSIRRAASPFQWKYEQQCGNPNNIGIVSDNSELKNISKQEYLRRCCFKITCTLRPGIPPSVLFGTLVALVQCLDCSAEYFFYQHKRTDPWARHSSRSR